MRTSACFRGKLKNSRRYHSSKNKKIRDRVASSVLTVVIVSNIVLLANIYAHYTQK